MPVLYVNDTDLGDLGFKVTEITGLLGTAPPVTLPGLEIPGRAGLLPATSVPKVGMRPVTAQLVVARQASLAAMEAAMVQLGGLVRAGRVELRDGRDPSKVCAGLLLNEDEFPSAPAFIPPLTSRVTLRFECEPYRRDVSWRSTAFQTTPVAVTLGTAPNSPVLILTGNDPVVRLRNAAGLLLVTMGFTITQGANDFLIVDCRSLTIQKSVAGVVTDAYPTWTTKADGPIVLDPSEGPTLEMAANSGQAFYCRAW